MRIAVMQPYIFPYLGYFQLISAVDKFVFYDDVNFITRGWINRNNILVNNKASLFTIPLKDASQNKLINEIELVNEIPWKQKILKTIELSYKKAPCYKEVFPLVSDVINFNSTHINQLAQLSIRSFADYLDIPTTFLESSTAYENRELKAQKRILDICILEKASEYINPIGGVDLYSRDYFIDKGIDLYFLKSRAPIYKQFNQEFVPSLSIIDTMMFNSKEEVKLMLLQYDLT